MGPDQIYLVTTVVQVRIPALLPDSDEAKKRALAAHDAGLTEGYECRFVEYDRPATPQSWEAAA